MCPVVRTIAAYDMICLACSFDDGTATVAEFSRPPPRKNSMAEELYPILPETGS